MEKAERVSGGALSFDDDLQGVKVGGQTRLFVFCIQIICREQVTEIIGKSDPIQFLRIRLEKLKPEAFSAGQRPASQSCVERGVGGDRN